MVKIKKLFINKIFSNIIMVENKSPICELKDNLDMAISKFIIDTKLQELLPKELRNFLPKNFEAEEESTVSKIVKFRTKQSQLISVKKTAKASSTISKEDAINKAKQIASITANDALDQEIKLLQRSIDLGSLDDIECGLDSSTLEESIEQIDENNYKITKDLILIDLDLIIKKDEVLTIPNGINLTNKKHIKNFGKIINYGNILNLNGISNYLEYNGGQFISYSGSSYKGKVQDVIAQSESSVSWPEGTTLFFIPNPNTVTISNNSNIYTITQNSSSSSTITLNFYEVPQGITGFYLTNIQTIGGGGGGGGGLINTPGGDLYATIAYVGNGGCGGANILTSTLNYYNESNNNPLPISGGLTINFTTGSGGIGGTCPKSIPTWTYSSDPSNGAGSPGGQSSLSISTTTNPNFFSQQAGGGDGGYVLNILAQEDEQYTFNSSSNYFPLANPTSSSSQYYDTTTGDQITTPIIVEGYSGGYGGMSYNAKPNYNIIPDSTNGQGPSGGFLGAGGGSGVAQGAYSESAGGQSGNPYSGNQSGGGGGGITTNVGGLGYQYYTSIEPYQPSPSIGGGGGGAGALWMDQGSNSGQNGGSGYNSITITFV